MFLVIRRFKQAHSKGGSGPFILNRKQNPKFWPFCSQKLNILFELHPHGYRPAAKAKMQWLWNTYRLISNCLARIRIVTKVYLPILLSHNVLYYRKLLDFHWTDLICNSYYMLTICICRMCPWLDILTCTSIFS